MRTAKYTAFQEMDSFSHNSVKFGNFPMFLHIYSIFVVLYGIFSTRFHSNIRYLHENFENFVKFSWLW